MANNVEVVECPPCILPTPFGEALTVIKELKARLEVARELIDSTEFVQIHNSTDICLKDALAATDLTLPFPKAE